MMKCPGFWRICARYKRSHEYYVCTGYVIEWNLEEKGRGECCALGLTSDIVVATRTTDYKYHKYRVLCSIQRHTYW